MNDQRYKYRWVILGMVYICMLVFAFALQSVPPILPLIISELRLTHTQAGLLMSLFNLPSIFLAVLAGVMADRLGPFKVGVTSLLLVIAGTVLTAMSRSFLPAGLGRVVAGSGAVTLTIVSAKVLSQWFRGREVGSAMGIYNTAMPVGSMICFMIFGRLGENWGWRGPVFIAAAVGAVGLACFVFLYRPAGVSDHSGVSVEREAGSGRLLGFFGVGGLIWLAGLCWLWFNAAVISFSTFAPDYFVTKGHGIGYAGFLTSLLMWGSLVLSPVIGRLIDRFDGNEVFIGLGGLILAASLFLLPKSGSFLLPMIVMAVAVAFVPTPVFSYLSKNLPPGSLGIGFGLLGMCSGVGMFLGPFVSGMIHDKTNSYKAMFLVLAVFANLVTLTAVVLRVRMKKTERKASEDA